MTPAEEVVNGILATVDSEHIRLAWQKAIDRRRCDPDGAITIARTLVEAVCNTVLGPGAYENDWDLGKLYREAARRLRLDADRHADESLKQLLRAAGRRWMVSPPFVTDSATHTARATETLCRPSYTPNLQ